MANNYRIKYKSGDFEIEVESSDKAFVESKLQELIQDNEEKEPVRQTKKTIPRKRAVSNRNEGSDSESQGGGIDIMAVVNAISDADNHQIIEKNILKKVNQLNRILLVFYFAHEINKNVGITTGDIQAVTHQMGIRIKNTNAGKCIKDNAKYFAAENVRKRGAVVKYKINRKGIEEFERIIAS